MRIDWWRWGGGWRKEASGVIASVVERVVADGEGPSFSGGRWLLKATIDRVGAVIMLLVLAPLLLAIGTAIKLEDRGPVFFRQERVGRGGSTFAILKFRSMVVDAESRLRDLAALNEAAGPLFKLRMDPRVTRVGAILRRYSLDELPQLVNVAKGHMSLVGPRPPLPREVASYAHDARLLREDAPSTVPDDDPALEQLRYGRVLDQVLAGSLAARVLVVLLDGDVPAAAAVARLAGTAAAAGRTASILPDGSGLSATVQAAVSGEPTTRGAVTVLTDSSPSRPDGVVFPLVVVSASRPTVPPQPDVSATPTMNKTMEYMSFELPVVAFDLVETRVSAGDAAVYAEPNLVERYAEAILDLLDDEAERKRMSSVGRKRVEETLAWRQQAPAYVGVYDRLVER